jgi:SAM-dependent methyltransferase
MKNNLVKVLSLIWLPIKSIFFLFKAKRKSLPGTEFDSFGRFLGIRLLLKRRISPKLLLNPISIVRYFEFDFVNSNLKCNEFYNILDISSPYLFGFYLSTHNVVNYIYLNPDSKDLFQVAEYSKLLSINENLHSFMGDATRLSFADDTFDRIISISVIEHISDNGDSLAIKEMLRVLKPGGLLLLTTPVQEKFEIEFRKDNIYNLKIGQKNGEFFFQRKYNDETINTRLLSQISNYIVEEKVIFGELQPRFYENYVKRWKTSGYWETVKDPYYISNCFTYFNSTNDLPGIGVLGLAIRKVR